MQLAEAKVALLSVEAAADRAEADLAAVQTAIAECLRRARNSAIRDGAAERRRVAAAASSASQGSKELSGNRRGIDAEGGDGIAAPPNPFAAMLKSLQDEVGGMHRRVAESDARLAQLRDEMEETDTQCVDLERELAIARARHRRGESRLGSLSESAASAAGESHTQSLADEMEANDDSINASKGDRNTSRGIDSALASDGSDGVDAIEASRLRAEIAELAREVGVDASSVPCREKDIDAR